MIILALLFACGLGFGLALLLFSILLEKSNDIGNSVGSYTKYTAGITYDILRNEMTGKELEDFGKDYISKEDKERSLKFDPEEDI